MANIKYSKTSLINGKLIDKTINLDINVSFSEFCEHEIKHAEIIANCQNGKTKVIQGKASLYIQFIDMPHLDLIEMIFIV